MMGLASAFGQFGRDVRYGLRQLRRTPTLTGAAVLTLGLGIGANVMVFSIINCVIIRPLPFKDSQHLVVVGQKDLHTGADRPISATEFLAWQKECPALSQIAALAGARMELDRGGDPIEISGRLVSRNFFPLLRAEPLIGRTFLPEDYRADAPRIAVVSYGFWMRYFGGDSQVMGKSVGSGRQPSYTVVGVMPPNFALPEGVEFWSPNSDGNLRSTDYGVFMYSAIGRLAPGVVPQQAEAQTDAIVRRLALEYPKAYSSTGAKVISLHEQIVGNARASLLVLMGAVFCVLLIACANLANLLLARGSARRKEIAIRLGIGASRTRLMRQLLTESSLLAFFGGAFGLALAGLSLRLFLAFAPKGLPRVNEVHIDSAALLCATILAVFTGLVFGIFPAIQAVQQNVNDGLKDSGGGRWYADQGRTRLKSALVVVDIAIALVLSTGAGLLIKSFVLLLNVTLGFEPSQLLTVRWAGRSDLIASAVDRLRSLPGVQSVGAVTALPVTGSYYSGDVTLEGMAALLPDSERMVYMQTATPDYFRTIGIRIRRGRGLSETDSREAALVAVVNETLAKKLFESADPIGKRFRRDNKWYTIVGVVNDTRHISLEREVNPEAFFSYQQERWWSDVNLVLRTKGDPVSLASTVRFELRGLDKTRPIKRIQSMDALIADSVAPRRFQMELLSLFAGLSLLLAAVGIYGLISYWVGERTTEFGVRSALGAEGCDILWLVLSQALSVISVGLLGGVICSLAATRVLGTFLFHMDGNDPLTYCATCTVLFLVGLTAAYVPARRAARIDSAVALRNE